MSSLRRIDSSRANGARSRGPITPDGRERASANALRHGLLAKCLVLENESNECFDDLVTQHIRRFAPADGVEFAMIEEMVAANWRMRRAWAIGNRLMDQAICNQPPGDELSRLANAFSQLAAAPELNLLHRYEARLHRIYQRALANVLMLGEPELPNEPSPISEQCAPVAQGPGGDVPEDVDLPTPDALPAGADASPQIAALLGNHALPNEPNPIFEHQPPGPWPLAPGPWPLAPGPRPLAPGPRSPAPGPYRARIIGSHRGGRGARPASSALPLIYYCFPLLEDRSFSGNV